ncbi:MAG: protein TonB [Bacteroidia bacterium]|jgi:protein TonB
MYQHETEDVRNDRMVFAIFVAAALHLFLILGMTFEAVQKKSYGKQLNVTLATRPSTAVPSEAEHIAEFDQIGSGEEAPQDFLSSPRPAPNPSPDAQEFSQQPSPVPQAPLSSEPVLATAALANTKLNSDHAVQSQTARQTRGLNPEVDRLAQQLTSLEATLEDQSKAYADMPRVRRLTSLSAKRAVDAAYLHGWVQRLEAVGNKYYPEASLRYGIYGELRLLVIVREDGSLEDIEVLSSSGYAVLDEAAMKIVRLAAPFAPFPTELRATTDKLEIIRTWQYLENRLSSG